MEVNTINDMLEWLNKKPYWLIFAINKILNGGKKLSNLDIVELAEICSNTKNGNNLIEVDKDLFINYFGSNSHRGALRLKSLSNIEGINNLKPRVPLSFKSDNLNVVYGRNGAGKSGYIRILKNVCGARKSEILLNNVFNDIQEQKCTIDLEIDKKPKQILWKPEDNVVTELSNIDIFDSSCSLSYVVDDKEVSYEPPLLKFLTYLASISEAVGVEINNKIKLCTNEVPKPETELAVTDTILKLNSVKTKVGFNEEFGNLKWEESDDEKLKKLELELSRTSSVELIGVFTSRLRNLNQLLEQFEKLKKNVTEKNLRHLRNLDKEITKKEKEISESSQILKGQRIKGISSNLWRKLWMVAKEFSELEAYPTLKFPVTNSDSKCVLCQQDLNQDAKIRFTNLSDFVDSKLNEEVLELIKSKSIFLESLTDIWTDEYFEIVLAGSSLEISMEMKVKDLFKHSRENIEILKTYEDADVLKAFNDSEIISFLKADKESLEKKQGAFIKLNTEIGKNRSVKDINEMKAKRWICRKKSQIIKGLEDEEIRKLLIECRKTTNTSSFTTKKSDLAQILISEKFLMNFENELKKLGAGHLKVSIEKTKNGKGKVFYGVNLKNAKIQSKIEHILSEGEFRIVSLAAFLADVADKPFNSPFVFDDPISSLDAEFEERCVKRLLELSEERQVIIFTHRLSFLNLLIDGAEKGKIHTVSVVSEFWGTGEPNENEIESSKPIAAVNILLTTRLVKAKKAIEQSKDDYLILAKSMTSEFRILLEKIVEETLLYQIVLRYRRGIQTQGRLQYLLKIKKSDLDYIEELMTKYSTFEHSQSSELVSSLPSPEEFESDLTTLKDWLVEFGSRKVDLKAV